MFSAYVINPSYLFNPSHLINACSYWYCVWFIVLNYPTEEINSFSTFLSYWYAVLLRLQKKRNWMLIWKELDVLLPLWPSPVGDVDWLFGDERRLVRRQRGRSPNLEPEETLLLLYFLPRDEPLWQIKITLDWYSTAVLQGSLTDFYLFLGISHSPTKTSDSVI